MSALAHQMCPHCGYDIERDVPILINDFSMFGPGYPLCYLGKPLGGLTIHESELCWALLKSFPRYVRYTTLLDRIDSTGTLNTLNVHVSRLRHKFSDLDIPFPIGTVRGYGYIWNAGGVSDEVVAAVA